MKYYHLLTYLLTDQLLADNYLWQFYGITSEPCVGKILLQGIECYKDTQMKAYNKYDKYVEHWRDLEI